MCFTGGFALGMMVDETMVAPVLSQPSLPIGFSKSRRAALGLAPLDLAAVKERAAAGCDVLGLRFTGDKLAAGRRFETLRRELGDASSASRSTRPRATRTASPRTPTRC